jgi:hypothetical protein
MTIYYLFIYLYILQSKEQRRPIALFQLTNHRYPLGNISPCLSTNQNFYISDTRERGFEAAGSIAAGSET